MSDFYGAELRAWPWTRDHEWVEQFLEALGGHWGATHTVSCERISCSPSSTSATVVLTAEVDEAVEGVEAFSEPDFILGDSRSLIEQLIAADLGFTACDLDKVNGYEISWRPGLRNVRKRPIFNGMPTLGIPEGMELLAGPELDIADRLRNYFAPVDEYREPEGTGSEAALRDWPEAFAVVGVKLASKEFFSTLVAAHESGQAIRLVRDAAGEGTRISGTLRDPQKFLEGTQDPEIDARLRRAEVVVSEKEVETVKVLHTSPGVEVLVAPDPGGDTLDRSQAVEAIRRIERLRDFEKSPPLKDLVTELRGSFRGK